MLTALTYLWRGARDFRPGHVDALARMIYAHATKPIRVACVTDYSQADFHADVEVIPLPPAARALLAFKNPSGEKFPVSYPRLWTLSEEAAQLLGDLVMLIDTDAIVLRCLYGLATIDADFVGWRVRPMPGNPRRFAGGTWLHRPGTRAHVWERFVADPQLAINTAAAAGYLGSDQAWISYNFSETEREWPEPSGIYCAQDWRNGWTKKKKEHEKLVRRRENLPSWARARRPPLIPPADLHAPADAVILHMNGEAKPWTVRDPVVDAHWRPFFRGEQ